MSSISAEYYDAGRARIVELVSRPGVDLTAPVAACPGWTARDLVAHLAGGLGHFIVRDFDSGGHANHGERTVAERRGKSLDELLAEWERNRSHADETLASPVGGVLVAEIISHEHDLRQALGEPGARDDPAVRAATERPLQEIDKRLREAGGQAVSVIVDGDEQVLGDGEATSTVRLTAFELLRAMGRRSERQLRALDWDGEPRLDVFTLFGPPREADLEE
ncbi:maleylpyruvate isomerase family mycothiol-dependent enzyme [Flindersiella endophytica]